MKSAAHLFVALSWLAGTVSAGEPITPTPAELSDRLILEALEANDRSVARANQLAAAPAPKPAAVTVITSLPPATPAPVPVAPLAVAFAPARAATPAPVVAPAHREPLVRRAIAVPAATTSPIAAGPRKVRAIGTAPAAATAPKSAIPQAAPPAESRNPDEFFRQFFGPRPERSAAGD
jgi:hypothetical protein